MNSFLDKALDKIKEQNELVNKLKNLGPNYMRQLADEYNRLEVMIEFYAQILFESEGAKKINSHFTKTFFQEDYTEQVRQLIEYENI